MSELKDNFDADYERKMAAEFIEGVTKLVSKYRTETGTGLMIGALEVVKLRVFKEAMEQVDKQMKEEGPESFTE